MNIGKALTWEELADIYDKSKGGRPARTMRMDTIFAWAERQTDKFSVSSDGTLHKTTRAQ